MARNFNELQSDQTAPPVNATQQPITMGIIATIDKATLTICPLHHRIHY